MKFFFNILNSLKFLFLLSSPFLKWVKYSWETYILWNRENHFHFGKNLRIKNGRNISIGKKVEISDNVDLIIRKSDKLSKIVLDSQVKVGPHCSLLVSPGESLIIGEGSSLHSFCRINGNVKIGKWCLFASHVFLSSSSHVFDQSPSMPIRDQDLVFSDKAKGSPICIEDDCWIGWGVVIKDGVTIGKGSIIGSNSVVTKDIPPYSVVGGIPAKILKSRLTVDLKRSLNANELYDRIFFWNGFKSRDNELLKLEGRCFIEMDKLAQIKLNLNQADELQIQGMARSQENLSLILGHTTKNYTIAPGEFNLKIPLDNCNSETVFLERSSSASQNFFLHEVRVS